MLTLQLLSIIVEYTHSQRLKAQYIIPQSNAYSLAQSWLHKEPRNDRLTLQKQSHTYKSIRIIIIFIYMPPTTEKRLFNRFDQYEIASVFTQSAEDYFSKKLKSSWRRFIFKAILGILLFINGYLSHWGPWEWPDNYYILAFSVVFYHLGSYLYSVMTGVNNTQGNFVGDYIFESQVKGVIVRINENREKYHLEVLNCKQPELNLQLKYTDYFTIEGYFLQNKYHQVLERLIASVKKVQGK